MAGRKKGIKNMSWEQVHRIRRLYVADKNLTQKQLALDVGVRVANVNKILHNVTWEDKNYTPPSRCRTRPGDEERHPAFKYRYHCKLCGMGCENQQEANDCCRPKRDTAPSSGTSKPKYGLGGRDETYLR